MSDITTLETAKTPDPFAFQVAVVALSRLLLTELVALNVSVPSFRKINTEIAALQTSLDEQKAYFERLSQADFTGGAFVEDPLKAEIAGLRAELEAQKAQIERLTQPPALVSPGAQYEPAKEEVKASRTSRKTNDAPSQSGQDQAPATETAEGAAPAGDGTQLDLGQG